MKFFKVYSAFAIVLVLLALASSIKVADKSTIASTAESLEMMMGAPVQNYFWLQRYFPGKDPVKYLELSDQYSERKFFKVVEDAIYFGSEAKSIAIIEGTENQII